MITQKGEEKGRSQRRLRFHRYMTWRMVKLAIDDLERRAKIR